MYGGIAAGKGNGGREEEGSKSQLNSGRFLRTMHWVQGFAGKLDVREVQRRGGRRRGHVWWDCSRQKKGWEGGGRQQNPTKFREVSENLIENPHCCELEAASDLLRWIGAMDFLAVAASVSASNALQLILCMHSFYLNPSLDV
jgi:hypothetical protein